MRRLGIIAAILALLTLSAAARQNPAPPGDLGTTAFESYIELLRQQAGIPAISGALLQDGVVVWERGLGFANVETRVRATPDTPYPIADLSQSFAAVLLLQCVEQRRLDLDVPIREYGIALTDSGATLRRVLSHSSSGTGGAFRYDPERYSQLTAVMEYCAPQPYRKSVSHRLLERLAMIDSVPGRDVRSPEASPESLYTPAALERYAKSLERMAVAYRVDKKGRATRNDVIIDGINAATGIISTVRDLARFDAALDSDLLLTYETLAAAWSPAQAADRTPLPMGLGWFVQTYRGAPVIWHFGVVPHGYSSMVVKVPSRKATMILLANSDGLAIPFQLESGDVTRSLFASVFLRMLL
jgi:CubicO group peptidase (beta-lactamase class C family)